MGGPERAGTRRGLAIACVFAATLCLHYVHHLYWEHTRPPLQPSIDELADLARSRGIIDGEWPPADQAFYQDPLYPYFLAAMRRVGPNPTDEVALRHRVALVQLGGVAATAAVTCAMGAALHSTPAGVVAGLLVGACRELLVYARMPLKESLATLLSTLALAALIRARRRDDLAWVAASGFLLGAASLARGNLLAMIPLFALGLFALDPGSWGRRAGRALAFAVAAAIAIAPATVHNLRAGQTVLTTWQAGSNFYSGNHALLASPGGYVRPAFIEPGRGEVDGSAWRAEAERRAGGPLLDGEVSRHWFRAGLAIVAAEPWAWATLYVRKWLLFWNRYDQPDMIDLDFMPELDPWLAWPWPAFGWLVIAIVPALGVLAKDRLARPLAAYPLVTSVLVACFLINGRYRYAMIPPLAVGVAIFAIELARAARARNVRAVALGLVLLLPGAWLAHRPVERVNLAPWWHDLGLARLERDDVEGAVEAFGRAIEVAAPPRLARDSLTSLGTLLLREGDNAHGRAILERAVAIAPDHGPAHAELGRALFEAQEWVRAEVHLRRATELMPRQVVPWQNLAILLNAQGRAADALAAAEHAHDAVFTPDEWLDRLIVMNAYKLKRFELAAAHQTRRVDRVRNRVSVGPSDDEADLQQFVDLGFCFLALGDLASLTALLAEIDQRFVPTLAQRARATLEAARAER